MIAIKTKFFLIVWIIFSFIVLLIFRSALFQEWNPIPVVFTTLFIPFSDEWFAEYDKNKYITNLSWSDDRLKKIMKKKWFIFVEQLWSWYIFRDKNWNNLVVTWIMYSRFFRIYKY